MYRYLYCKEYTPSTLDTYPFPNPYQHVNTVKMSELIITPSAYIINGDSPMTSVANTVAMTSFAVHTLQPLIFFRLLSQLGYSGLCSFVVCILAVRYLRLR